MAKEPAKIAFKLMRAVWDKDGVRVDEGNIIEMTAEDALPSMESGAIVRATAEEVTAYKEAKAKAEAEAAAKAEAETKLAAG